MLQPDNGLYLCGDVDLLFYKGEFAQFLLVVNHRLDVEFSLLSRGDLLMVDAQLGDGFVAWGVGD